MGETTAMKDECGPESRLIVLLLRGDEHYLTGRFPPIFGCISLHNVRFCRCIWETASAAGNFDKTTARNFKLFVVLSGRAEAQPLTSATPLCRYFYSRSIGQQLDSQSVSKKEGRKNPTLVASSYIKKTLAGEVFEVDFAHVSDFTDLPSAISSSSFLFHLSYFNLLERNAIIASMNSSFGPPHSQTYVFCASIFDLFETRMEANLI